MLNQQSEEQIRAGFLCLDCKFDTLRTEYYMVNHEVWKASGLSIWGGMLCIACLETRLGRTLVPSDFLECPINRMITSFSLSASDRLLSRMLGRPIISEVA